MTSLGGWAETAGKYELPNSLTFQIPAQSTAVAASHRTLSNAVVQVARVLDGGPRPLQPSKGAEAVRPPKVRLPVVEAAAQAAFARAVHDSTAGGGERPTVAGGDSAGVGCPGVVLRG